MEKNKPIKTIKFGSVEASIWENTSEIGRKSHSVTFKRSYKDGDEWKTSDSYWAENLLVLSKVADAAYTAIQTELKR